MKIGITIPGVRTPVSPTTGAAVAAAALLLLLLFWIPMGATVQSQSQQQQGLPIVATDGGLSASVAKPNYNAGEFIVINGTVANYTDPSGVTIQVIDPKGRQVEYVEWYLFVRDFKNQFRYVFQAGLVKQFDLDHWMQISGEYKVVVTYQPPSLVTPEIEQVTLYFNYNNATTNATAVGG